jgi:hypothetical protein
MRQQVRVAIGLWMVLAAAVFSVMFDWQTRVAAHQFVRSQVLRHEQGQPVISINDGYRPQVREAARRSAVWLVVIAGAGTAAAIGADRRRHVREGMRAVPTERTQVR